MIVENIQSVKNVWPTYTKITHYKTTTDTETRKQNVEVIVYYLYNKRGVVETNQPNKVDIKV